MSICKTALAAGADHASSTGNALHADCARTRVGSNSSLPKLKDKNFASELCARVQSIDRAPPGGGLQIENRQLASIAGREGSWNALVCENKRWPATAVP